MTRRPARAPTRRLALALSLMLFAGALAVPAFASNHTTGNSDPGISSPVEGDTFYFAETLELRAKEPEATSVQWALRLVDPDPNSEGTFAGNVDGFSDLATFEQGEFSIDIDLSADRFADLPSSEEYYFVFNPSPGGRYEVQFELSRALDDFEPDEIELCNEDEECSINTMDDGDQTYTASTGTPAKEGQTARLGLRIAGTEDPVSQAVFAACQDELADDQRLGGDVAHLVPVGFAGGSLTVTNFIPKSIIKDDVNRGTDAFQVCIAPTEAEAEGYGAYFDEGSGPPAIGDTGLVGPFLLDDCGADPSETACVEIRERLPGADLLITYRIPAVDPWMM